MNERQIVIVGTGAEARIAADVFTAMGHVVLGFVETVEGKELRDLNDINVFAHYAEDAARNVIKDAAVEFMVAVGEIELRRKIYEALAKRAKRPAANAVHPLSWQSPYAAIGFGNIFNASSVVNANSTVGDHNHFHSGVSVETDSVIGSYCNFNSGVRIGANVRIDDEVFIGTGAIIHPGIHIGKGSLIGAGSVVVRSVEEGGKVFGNPAQSV